MLMSRSQKTGQKHSIKIASRSFPDVAQFKYLGTTLTDQNCMHEEIKSRLNLRECFLPFGSESFFFQPAVEESNVKVHKTIILPVVVYVCKTWSLTLTEEHRLGVFENRMLRRIFGPKRDEVMEEWRKLLNGELHNLYSSPNIIRQFKSKKMRWPEHVASMGEGRKVYRALVGRPQGKGPLERPRRR
jgi:hypothetical protein